MKATFAKQKTPFETKINKAVQRGYLFKQGFLVMSNAKRTLRLR